MRIRTIEHTIVCAPFTETISWGSGARSGATRLVCKVTTRDGTVGWGETLCLLDTVPAAFRRVAEIGIGYPVSDVERLHRNVLGAGYYHHKRAAVMAIAALEMAMWDALGKRTGEPLWSMWGGLWRNTVDAAAYTFTRDPEELGQRLAAFVDAGHRTFKVKIGFDARSDIALARAARETIGDADLRLDVNGAWTPGTARRQLEKLRPYDPTYVEQPLELDDLAGTAALRAAQPIPIALDESAYTLQDVGNIVRAGAADVVLLDPHQAGGLWQVIKQAAICEAHGIPVSLHSGAELALSQSAYVQLAAAIPNMSVAIDTERAYLCADISGDAPLLQDGAFAVPDAPGLGVMVDETRVDALRVDSITGAYLDAARPGWFPVKPAY
ncbi:MAG: mandelate racemase/muconate lactonizing enzyme family protein [Devosia sp.]